MVAYTLTDEKIKAGKELLQACDTSKVTIEAAFWLYFQDQESWKLMLSVKDINKEGPKSIYNKLQKLLKKNNLKEQLSLSEIALAKHKSPILDLLRSVIKTGPGISGIRFTENVINGQLIPDAYIYKMNA